MKYDSIVISGLPGAGKSSIYHLLSKKLRWETHSIGNLWREKWKALYPTAEISFEEYWRNVNFEEQLQVNIDANHILKKGNLILDSRYPPLNIKGVNSALIIFIKAPLEVRAKRALKTGKYSNLVLEEVEKILEEREIEEVRWGKKLYKEDYDYRDPSNYDLILDSEDLSIEEELEQILKLLNQ